MIKAKNVIIKPDSIKIEAFKKARPDTELPKPTRLLKKGK